MMIYGSSFTFSVEFVRQSTCLFAPFNFTFFMIKRVKMNFRLIDARIEIESQIVVLLYHPPFTFSNADIQTILDVSCIGNFLNNQLTLIFL